MMFFFPSVNFLLRAIKKRLLWFNYILPQKASNLQTFFRSLVNSNKTAPQMNIKQIIPTYDTTVTDSTLLHTINNENFEELFPRTTVYKNTLGGTIFVFSGTPKANYNIPEAFSFFNYSRKQQIIKMAEQTNQMPVYCPNDEEIYFRAAYMRDNSLFCAVFNIGLNPIEQLEISCKLNISKIEKLICDGTKKNISFRHSDEKYILQTPCYILNPVILFINNHVLNLIYNRLKSSV